MASKQTKTFSDASGRSYTCPVLNGKSDYAVWSYTLAEHLKSAKVDAFVLTDVKIESENREALQQAKSLLLSTIGASEIEKILHCTTAHEMWKHFQNAYGMKTANEKLELMTDMDNLSCKTAKEVPDVVSKCLSIKGKLTNLGVDVDDAMVICAIIKKLPTSFESFLDGWKMLDVEHQTLDRLISKLLDKAKSLADTEECALLAHRPGPSQQKGNFKDYRSNYRPQFNQHNHQPAAQSAYPRQTTANQYQAQRFFHNNQHQINMSNTVPNNVCSYCKKPGHWKADCRKRQRANASTNNPNNQSAASGQRFNNIVMMALDKTIGNNPMTSTATDWIVDSGCSNHMSSDKSIITNLTIWPHPKQIKIGDDSCLNAVGYGQVYTTIGKLQCVYFVPKLANNLFSVSAATDQQIEFSIKASGIFISKDDELLAVASRVGGTYLLKLEIIPNECAFSATTIEQWHQRLAHLPKHIISKMASENIVDGLRIINAEVACCADCRLNKCKRSSHKLRSTPKATKAGQSLHFDIIGPIKPDGLKGQRFILNCVDEFSNLRMVNCLKSKAQCPEQVKLMLSQSELQTGNSVLSITTDNGSEFLSERLTIFLEHKGIIHMKSAPYTPQQNGKIERNNRILLDQSRTVLNAAKMPHFLWPEAVGAVTYVANRCISKTKNITPYQLWMGKKPDLSNVKIFGEKAAVFLQDHQRTKFQSKATLMNFVGYTDNRSTYLFYNSIANTICISCDCSFLNETGLIINSEEHQNSPVEKPISAPFDFASLPNVVEHTITEDGCSEEMQQVENNNTSQNNIDISAEQTQFQSANRSISLNNDPTPLSSTPLKSFSGEDKISDDTLTPSNTAKPQSNISQDENQGQKSENCPVNQSPAIRNLRNREKRDYKALATGRLDLSKMDNDKNDNQANIAVEKDTTPNCFQEACDSADYEIWKEAMLKEIAAMQENDVYQLVERPSHDTNVVGSRWVYTVKNMPDGQRRPKARLVAQGFSQKFGVDFTSTYAPVVQMNVVRLLFALAARDRMVITQFDIATAFLNGSLSETIYMKQPQGTSDGTDRVWLLKKCIYGLKQAPRTWNQRFSQAIRDTGLTPTTTDNCVFHRSNPLTILIIYVDDALIFSQTQQSADEIILLLGTQFEVSVMHTNKFLGFQYFRDNTGSIYLHQTNYITSLLEKYGMNQCNVVDTPLSAGQLTGNETRLDNEEQFRVLIGELQYAATQTRIDLAFVVGYLGRKVTCPSILDMQTAKRCLRYLKGSTSDAIKYTPGNHQFESYTDADFAGDHKTYKSTSGCVILFAGGPIHWRSRLQRTVVTSTTEAEYLALSDAIKTTTFLKDFCLSIGVVPKKPIDLKCDNLGAVNIASDEGSSQRTRHMGAQLAYARQQHREEVVRVRHVPANEQLADCLTKALPATKFKAAKNLLLFSLINFCLITNIVCPPEKLQKIAPRIWVPLKEYPVADGHSTGTIKIPITDQCAELNIIFIQTLNEPMRRMVKETVDLCYKRRDAVLGPVVAKIIGYKNRQKRGTSTNAHEYPEQLKLNALTNCAYADLQKKADGMINSHDVGQGEAHYWLTWLIPGYESLYERYNSESVSNTVRSQHEIISDTAKATICTNEQIGRQIMINTGLINNVNRLTGIVVEDSKTLHNFISIYPRLTNAISKAEIWIQDDTKMLNELYRGLSKKELNLNTISTYTYKLEESGQLARLENLQARIPGNSVVEITKLEATIDYITIDYEVTTVDKTTIIFGSRYLKTWIDEQKYNLCDGEQYLIWSETNNCTRTIGKPLTQVVNLKCTEKDYYKVPELSCKEYFINENNSIEEFRPEMVKTNLKHAIQCFQHNITIGNDTFACPKFPFATSLYTPFKIGGLHHSYNHDIIEYANSTLKLLRQNYIEPPNPHRESFYQLQTTSELLNTEFEEMKARGYQTSALESYLKAARQFGSEHTTSLISTPVAVIILAIAMAIYIKIRMKRKNPVVEILEAQTMVNLTDSQSTKSNQSTLARNTPSAPSINIAINNINDPGKRLYPTMPRVDFAEQDIVGKHSEPQWVQRRPATPKPQLTQSTETLRSTSSKIASLARSTASLASRSLNSLANKSLNTASMITATLLSKATNTLRQPDTPKRFEKTKISKSVISLPATLEQHTGFD